MARHWKTVLSLIVQLALVTAPGVQTLTHGPATLAAKADPAAWHAEQDDCGETDAPKHHDATDHDHTPPALVAAGASVPIARTGDAMNRTARSLSGPRGADPGRPPPGATRTA